jgi:hypothetical protein
LSAIEDFKIFKIVGSGIIDPHFIEDDLGESQRAPGGDKGCSLEKWLHGGGERVGATD